MAKEVVSREKAWTTRRVREGIRAEAQRARRRRVREEVSSEKTVDLESEEDG